MYTTHLHVQFMSLIQNFSDRTLIDRVFRLNYPIYMFIGHRGIFSDITVFYLKYTFAENRVKNAFCLSTIMDNLFLQKLCLS